jgi:hypothetical protein
VEGKQRLRINHAGGLVAVTWREGKQRTGKQTSTFHKTSATAEAKAGVRMPKKNTGPKSPSGITRPDQGESERRSLDVDDEGN